MHEMEVWDLNLDEMENELQKLQENGMTRYFRELIAN
jgi:hypothetical protein